MYGEKKYTLRFYLSNEEDKKAYEYLQSLDKGISKQQILIKAINKYAEENNQDFDIANIIIDEVSSRVIAALKSNTTINNTDSYSEEVKSENDLLDFNFL